MSRTWSRVRFSTGLSRFTKKTNASLPIGVSESAASSAEYTTGTVGGSAASATVGVTSGVRASAHTSAAVMAAPSTGRRAGEGMDVLRLVGWGVDPDYPRRVAPV